MQFEDVMDPYSTWVGEWSEYWGNYAWQPLPGGAHRALRDCEAVLELLKEIAKCRGFAFSEGVTAPNRRGMRS